MGEMISPHKYSKLEEVTMGNKGADISIPQALRVTSGCLGGLLHIWLACLWSITGVLSILVQLCLVRPKVLVTDSIEASSARSALMTTALRQEGHTHATRFSSSKKQSKLNTKSTILELAFLSQRKKKNF